MKKGAIGITPFFVLLYCFIALLPLGLHPHGFDCKAGKDKNLCSVCFYDQPLLLSRKLRSLSDRVG